jgi:hypothetical protein
MARITLERLSCTDALEAGLARWWRALTNSSFDCDIPPHNHHAALTAKIWLRRNGLMLRDGTSPTRIDSGLAGVRLVMTRCARALQRPNARGAAT